MMMITIIIVNEIPSAIHTLKELSISSYTGIISIQPHQALVP